MASQNTSSEPPPTLSPAADLSITLQYDPSTASSSNSSSDSKNMLTKPPQWWKNTTVYQIWPTSYKDTTGSGTGDLNGIISTLPYLKSLGISTIWLSPIYASPLHDMGYDISDYTSILPAFGTLSDLDTLVSKAHALDIKIIMDLVINHTSDQHAWFKSSRESRTGPKADWYMWKDARYLPSPSGNGELVRTPPNNWASFFGGSAWEWCDARQQYYLHLFVKEQPDLNWENEATRHAIYADAITFWLKRGIDGFRIDTCNLYSKIPGLPDAPITDPTVEYQFPGTLTIDGPRAHEFLREMREAVRPFGEVMLVGELGFTDKREVLLSYVDASRGELGEVFDFALMWLGRESPGEANLRTFGLEEVKKTWKLSQELIEDSEAWTTCFGENHDAGRSVSRFATRSPKWHTRACQVMATMIASMSGTLFLYQGQEIGMTNVPPTWGPEEYKDIQAINYLASIRTRFPNDEKMFAKALAGLNQVGRDNARTPVQWDDSPNAGFTTGTPWMRVNDNYKEINVKSQVGKEGSVYEFWKRILELRGEEEELFVFGRLEMVDLANEKTFSFFKHGREKGRGRRLLVQLNFSEGEEKVYGDGQGGVLLSNVEGGKNGMLAPWEARISVIS